MQERFLLQEKCPEVPSLAPRQAHHIITNSFKPLGSVTGGRVSLLGCPALFCPQCLEEKSMNKTQSEVCGVQRGLLSLGTQKLRGEDDRQGKQLCCDDALESYPCSWAPGRSCPFRGGSKHTTCS